MRSLLCLTVGFGLCALPATSLEAPVVALAGGKLEGALEGVVRSFQGMPACPGVPKWPAYSSEEDLQIELGEEVSVEKVGRAAAFDLIVGELLAPAQRQGC